LLTLQRCHTFLSQVRLVVVSQCLLMLPLCSLLDGNDPKDLQLVLIDPKQVELLPYSGIQHLAQPIATDADSARDALRFVVAEMDNRYKLLASVGARNIGEYRDKGYALSYMVVVIDELADLMMVARKEVESSIVRITQLARAAGIHLIVATQRPSVDVITGLIKANMPSRIAFTVASTTDSRVVIDGSGAEFLTGRGDGLFVPQGSSKPIRFQGVWIDEDIVSQYAWVWRKSSQLAEQVIVPEELIAKAEAIALSSQYVSAKLLERRLGVDSKMAQEILSRIPSQEYVF
jgi:DNA segregation ATPase FtsK/SpoIIIE, S-DNA-T family